VTGYHLSESSATPALTAAGWIAVPSTTVFSTTVPFTVSNGEGAKIIYAWYKDAADNVFDLGNDSIVLQALSSSEASPGLALALLASGLAYPVGIAHAGDGSGRLFIVLQGGKIVIYDGTQILDTPFLDLTSLVSCCGERGLLGLAFHPSYASNGFFYVNYTNTVGDTVIARYRVSANPNIADAGSAQILLTIAQPYANHNGGQLQFGPDGYLYIAMGDGGATGDPENRAQNLGELLGKLLRIDVDGDVPYAAPPTNPFVGRPGAQPEIWTLGLRNPWRFSFDRLTGDLFIADVGQGAREEVDVQPATSAGGENYGWRRMEGTACYNPKSACNDETLMLPVLEYTHDAGECSITGGYRYRGTQVAGLGGTYLYGDYCSGRIWGATQGSSGEWTSTQLLDTPYSIATFGEDQDGELYMAHHAGLGALYRIIKGSGTLTVNAGSTPVTVAAGSTVTVGLQNGPGNATDWVGLFVTGAADTDHKGRWLYLNGTKTPPPTGLTSGTLRFTLPSTPGTYEFRFFKNNGFELLATSPLATVE
jgi:glucose/arabinose dehydrogenase